MYPLIAYCHSETEHTVEFSIKSGPPPTGRAGCVVAGVFEPRKLSGPAASLDRAANGYLTAALRRGDMEGKAGTTLLLRDVPGVPAESVLVLVL